MSTSGIKCWCLESNIFLLCLEIFWAVFRKQWKSILIVIDFLLYFCFHLCFFFFYFLFVFIFKSFFFLNFFLFYLASLESSQSFAFHLFSLRSLLLILVFNPIFWEKKTEQKKTKKLLSCHHLPRFFTLFFHAFTDIELFYIFITVFFFLHVNFFSPFLFFFTHSEIFF